MKKLLSLLSVLTISGTAVPTTIAASPYQKEETKLENNEISYLQTNNLKNLNRNKRENKLVDVEKLSSINLEVVVPTVRQTESFSCGPAIAESLLRSLGLGNLRRLNTQLYTCQQRLISTMETTLQTENFNFLGGGTIVTNWANTINNYIINGGLNNFRRYVTHSLNPSINDPTLAGSTRVGVDYNNYTNLNIFLSLIYNSLNNSMPVALGFTGRFNDNEPRRNHFILINGIYRNTSTDNNLYFNYMDPDGGVMRRFSSNQLNSLLSNGGFLIYHDPRTIGHNIQIHESMEIGNCLNPVIQTNNFYCEINLSFNRTDRFVRQINNNQCPVINKDNPFFQKNDVFEVDYQFLAHDKIKLKISLKTSLGIEKMFFENNGNKFNEYLIELFKKMPKHDNTGSGGSITDDDYNVMKDFIYNNYSYFHNAFKNLQNNNKYNWILVNIDRGTSGLSPGSILLIE